VTEGKSLKCSPPLSARSSRNEFCVRIAGILTDGSGSSSPSHRLHLVGQHGATNFRVIHTEMHLSNWSSPHTAILCCRYKVCHAGNEGHAVLSAEAVPVAAR
jgi:hypothetical protein